MSEKPTFDQLLEGAMVEVAKGRGAVNCTFILAAQGKAYPRTCQRCGLGPCAFTTELMAARPKSAEPPAPSPPMTQPDLARLEGLSARLREMVSADGRSICCNKRTTAQMGSDILEAAVSLPALLARVRELEKALEPFAKAADDIEREYGKRPAHQYQFPPLMMRDFTRARAALTLNKEPTDANE